MFVFVMKLSKEKAYFMYGWTWEMEHKMYYHLLTWVSVWDSAPYFHSSVSNVNFALWKGGWSRNITCMPRWRFNVLNVQLHKYIYYWSLEIFKSTCCSYIFFWFWDISPYWSLAYWSIEIGRWLEPGYIHYRARAMSIVYKTYFSELSTIKWS